MQNYRTSKVSRQKILEYGKINEQIDPQGMKEEQKVKCCLKTPKYLLEKPRVCSSFDTFSTILLSKAPPISRNDLMPQKRLPFHKLCQQISKKLKFFSC